MNESVNQTVSGTGAWPTERWTAILVIAAVVLLMLIRAGVRGVDIMGASVRVN